MASPAPVAPYTIVTPRLALRAGSPEFAAKFTEAIDASIDGLRPWMTWAAELPQPVAHHLNTLRGFRSQFERDEGYIYTLFDRVDDACAGGCGLHKRVGPDALEIGYWVRSDRTNRGYATELAAALTRVGFDCFTVRRMEIRVAVGNDRSSAVPRKLGYELETTLRERIPLPGDRLGDCQVWTMFAADFPASAAAKVPVEALDAVGRRMG